jgi:hypothetical protein
MGSKAFVNMAAGSAEFHAVNAALHAGSKPEDLVSASIRFLEAPTEEGKRKAQRVIDTIVKGPGAKAGS